MKKYLCIILALALALSLSVPAFAANETEKRTDFSYIKEVPEPSYTVTIPASLQLRYEETVNLTFTVQTENLGGKNVYIFFEGTQDEDDLLLLYNAQAAGLGYSNKIAYGIDAYLFGGAYAYIEVGEGLLKFEGSSTDKISFFVTATGNETYYKNHRPGETFKIAPSLPYTGYIVFGIRLV